MKGGSSNPSGAQLSASARLKAQREVILELWLERVRQSLPAAKAQHEPQLLDRLPELLDLLALALSPEGLPPRSADDLNDVSQHHGTQRSRLEGYSLQQLLREYQLLREVLFGVLEREAPLTPTERDILLSALDQAMAEAGERFMRYPRKEAERVRDSSEARLRIAQEQLQLALESAQMGAWHIDLETNQVTSSPGLAAIIGIAEHADNIFELITTLMHPEDRDEVNRVWQEAVSAGTPYQHEYRIIRPDGSIRWMLARGTVTPGPDGRPAYFAGVSEST